MKYRNLLIPLWLLVVSLVFSACNVHINIETGANGKNEATEISATSQDRADQDLAQGLVAYWSFDKCDASDGSGNGLNGVVYGRLECVHAVKGKGIRLQSHAYIEVPNAPAINFSPSGEFSIALWVRNESPEGEWKALVVKSPISGWWNYGLYISKENLFMGGFHNTHVVYSTSLADEQWHAVVLTYNGGTWQLYVDGQLEDEVKDGPKIDQSNGALAIGRKGESDNNFDYFEGYLDEVRLYNRVLTPSEIQFYSRR